MKRVYKAPFNNIDGLSRKPCMYILDANNAFVCECDSTKNAKEVVKLLNSASSNESL